MRCRAIGFLVLGLVVARHSAHAGCSAWTSYKDAALHRLPDGSAYAYMVDTMAIDADGAPNAYHPEDRGLDLLANAGYPHGGWRSVLVTDPADQAKPYVQPPGEFAGFYLSKTALQDGTKRTTDPARWVDARNVPYVVFPGGFMKVAGSGRLGEIGMARNMSTGETSPMILADVGEPDQHLGEVSIKLAENLGGHDVSPRNGRGTARGPFAYVLFPGSGAAPPWPLTMEQLQQRADTELAKVGGWPAVVSCLRSK